MTKTLCPNCQSFDADFEHDQIGPLFTGSNGPYVETFEDVWTCTGCGHTVKSVPLWA